MALPGYNVSPPDDRITIVCLHCDKPQEVGRKTMSLTCKFCHKPLRLEDVTFKAYEARRAIETCGIVTVEKKANVVSDRIHCGGIIIRGKIKGHITSRGPVLVGPEAQITGNVTAPTIAIGGGAVLEGQYQIGRKRRPRGERICFPFSPLLWERVRVRVFLLVAQRIRS